MKDRDGEEKYQLRIDKYEDASSTHYRIVKSSMLNGRAQTIEDINGRQAKVYNPSLYLMLSAQLYPAYNNETGEECEVSTYEYFTSYCEGFYEGEKYFIENFNVPLSSLYGENSGKYVDNLRANHFEVLHEKFINGWAGIKESFPIIVSHGIMAQFGYYSGIVSQVEALAEKHPSLFPGFISYIKSAPVHKTDTNKTKSQFSKANLLPIIQGFKQLQGYESPVNILDELLEEVEQFNDKEFRHSLFLNIHHLCQENKELIWSGRHRNEISAWLRKVGIVSLQIDAAELKNLFETTWDILPDEADTIQLNKIHPGAEQLKLMFATNGFFNLPATSLLSERKKDELINLINDGNDQFKVAMLEHLGIIKYLKPLSTGKDLNKKLSAILKVGERRIKGNINSFIPTSADRKVYKAYQELNNVKNAYNQLLKQN